jgi:hypothetical protein
MITLRTLPPLLPVEQRLPIAERESLRRFWKTF